MEKTVLSRLFAIEMKNLALGLVEKGIPFEFKILYNGYQIVTDSWDAVCHSGSDGHTEGKLEVMGSIVHPDIEDDVEGYLTADEILRRL